MSKPPVRHTPATPLGHLKSIELTAGGCARNKDAKRLTKYLRSPELAESLGAIDADMRERAVRALAKAMAACESRYPAIPKPGTARAPSTKDPAGRQRIIDAWNRTGTDRGLAQLLQIPLPAATTARWKVIGPIRQKTPPEAGNGGDARQLQR